MKFTITSTIDVSATSVISLLQGAGSFKDVKALPGRDLKSVTFQMEVVPAVAATAREGNMMADLLSQLRTNARLRIGLVLIIAIAWLYGVLTLRDEVQAQQQRFRSSHLAIARLQAQLAEPEWANRSTAARALAVQLENKLWQAPTPGLAQAAYQDWLTIAMVKAGVANPQITVSVVEEAAPGSSAGPADSSGAPDALADVWKLRCQAELRIQSASADGFSGCAGKQRTAVGGTHADHPQGTYAPRRTGTGGLFPETEIGQRRTRCAGCVSPSRAATRISSTARRSPAMMRFVHNNLLALWLALALLAGATCWFGTRTPTPPAASIAATETWALVKLPDNQSRKSMDAISARNLWGIVNAANAAPPPPVWNIQGIARTGNDRFVLLAFEGKPVEILKVGDSLPDGAKIVQIDNDRFLVQTADRKKLAFGIYKNETQK